MKNFWKKINRPILALAPMAGITDSAFRQMCKEYGADVVYSEMASVNALAYAPEKTLEMLKFSKVEKPYIVQLFGSEPEYFKKAVKIVEKELLPDGIDINFGCPVPKVVKQKAGAELSKDLRLSKKVVKSVVENTELPVSVKIRKQVGKVNALQFLDNISDLNVKTVMIHGRSISQMHSGPVDADIIKKARNYFGGVILSNGGVYNRESYEKLLKESNANGVGIGQGALGRPWIFSQLRNGNCVSREDIFDIALRHVELAYKNIGKQGIVEMRKHLCWYAQGLPNARRLREKFVQVKTINDIKKIITHGKIIRTRIIKRKGI